MPVRPGMRVTLDTSVLLSPYLPTGDDARYSPFIRKLFELVDENRIQGFIPQIVLIELYKVYVIEGLKQGLREDEAQEEADRICDEIRRMRFQLFSFGKDFDEERRFVNSAKKLNYRLPLALKMLREKLKREGKGCRELRRKMKSVGLGDALIAATATITQSEALVTTDTALHECLRELELTALFPDELNFNEIQQNDEAIRHE